MIADAPAEIFLIIGAEKHITRNHTKKVVDVWACERFHNQHQTIRTNVLDS
jgi:hypothetical protein